MGILNLSSQLNQNILGICLLVWVIVEYRIMVKQDKRPSKKDIRAIILFSILTLVFAVLSIFIFENKLGNMKSHFNLFFWIGIFTIFIGIVIRQYSMYIMGSSYVATLQVQEKPTLIKKGPFKVVRHPCYTGFMISLWGLGISLLNWDFFILTVIFSASIFLIQIGIEEKELEKFFGDEYVKYKKKTKKLLPFVL